MYKDMVEKLKFHKEKIIQGFIDIGIYPSETLIENMLSSVDNRLAYLSTSNVKKGMTFDCDVYNNMVNSTYRDLVLLYKILEELAVKEYVELQAYLDTHLLDLQKRANYYKTKAEQETNTTSLGKTILFKNDSYNIKIKDHVAIIDLGKVALHNSFKVACLLNANEIEGDKAIFTFSKDGESYRVCPHNYNEDIFKVPGELNKKVYEYTLDKDQLINGTVKMENITPNHSNKYTILGGKDKVVVKQFGETVRTSVKNKPTSIDELGFNEKSYIDFYLVGAKSISFTFNKKPVSTNFSLDSYTVTNLDPIHHFFIECEAGFAFSFTHEGGEIYGIKTPGVITNNAVMYTGAVHVNTFKVIEYTMDKTEDYDLTLEIINDDAIEIDIESIIVKELVVEG